MPSLGRPSMAGKRQYAAIRSKSFDLYPRPWLRPDFLVRSGPSSAPGCVGLYQHCDLSKMLSPARLCQRTTSGALWISHSVLGSVCIEAAPACCRNVKKRVWCLAMCTVLHRKGNRSRCRSVLHDDLLPLAAIGKPPQRLFAGDRCTNCCEMP